MEIPALNFCRAYSGASILQREAITDAVRRQRSCNDAIMCTSFRQAFDIRSLTGDLELQAF